MRYFRNLARCWGIAGIAFGLGACGSSTEGDGEGGGDGGAGASNGAGGIMFNTGTGSTNGLGFDECVTETARAEAIPFDLYVMFDQSGSMVASAGDGTRLDAVRGAFADFLRDPESTGLGVGIGYFGYLPLGQTSCDPTDYEDPSVGIDLLPEHADAMLASLNGVQPTGETPTGAAIRGACTYVSDWKAAHPNNGTAILLVTDGVPEAPLTSQGGTCNPTLPDAVAATKTCVKDEKVSIYVLGVGPSLANLNQIADAGGTKQAYLVEGGDVSAQVLSALNAIRGDSLLPCEFKVPEPPAGQTLSYDLVNVVLTNEDDKDEVIPFVTDAAGCEGEDAGWHYDGTKERIVLCEQSCSRVRGESVGGSLKFAIGCEQVVPIK